ncbi:NB-ARC domain [Mycobacteroides abscessus subsp. abscessus]|nr:NB-ARC domain [Mycobacteroides abscessus subsp. abscessus]SLE09163.1 NB-ARC domain [Mycobacteroides abscessus subsp. abscessus]
MNGGSRAASGLFYQYLFTLETFLTLIAQDWPEQSRVLIEGPGETENSDPDVVDFSVYHPRDGLHAIYQVKSVAVPAETTISANEALRTLIRMVRAAESPAYVLVTNARAGRDLDQLRSVLGRPSADAELLSALHYLARNSTETAAALSSITTPDQVSRLRRARVQATGMEAELLRARIVEQIRSWRSTHRLALGERAAHILESSLITEVFVRAARIQHASTTATGSGGHELTLADFMALLAAPSTILAHSAAQIEAGDGIEHVPNRGGVERPEQMQQIVDRLSNVRSTKAQLCALVGPSGIGKTRLAAMYVHLERGAYDRVCWLDAESDASIIASIIGQRLTIGLPEITSTDSDDIAAAFKKCVSSFIGRWLVVFDNAAQARHLQRWISAVDNAQFLVTSTNAVDWTGFDPIDIPCMTPKQAHALLMSRFKDDLSSAPAEQRHHAMTALRTLAAKLEFRPLALQIAASHFETLSALVYGIDTYTAQITDYIAQIIDDETLDLDGYPRTLQAAILICLDRLAAVDTGDGAIALAMLLYSSVLASRSIPAWLVFAAATEHAESLMGAAGPPAGLKDKLPVLNSALRCIRAQSLIDRPDDYPSKAQVRWELHRRFDVNEIVQHVIRQRVELMPVLNIVAGHLSAWLAGYMTGQDFHSAALIQPHALQALWWAERADDDDVLPCSVLAGNIALFLNLQGRSSEAVSWLHFEYRLLAQLHTPSHTNTAKTSVQIIEAMARAGDGATYKDIEPYIGSAVGSLEAIAAAGSADRETKAICLNLLENLTVLARSARHDEPVRRELDGAYERITLLLDVFPDRDSADQQLVRSIERCLESGQYEQVLSLSQDLPGRINPRNHVDRLKIKFQRLEALAGLQRIAPLQIELAAAVEDREHHPQVKAGVGLSLLNTATKLALAMAVQPDGDHGLARQVFAAIIRVSSTLCTNDYEHYFHTVMAAFECGHHSDLTGVRALLELAAAKRPAALPLTVADDPEAPPQAFTMHAWLDYWLECTDAGTQALAVAGSIFLDRTDSHAAERPRVGVLAYGLGAQIAAAAGASQTFHGRWQSAMLCSPQALRLAESGTGRPVACILFAAGPVPAHSATTGGPALRWADCIEEIRTEPVLLTSAASRNDFVIVTMN